MSGQADRTYGATTLGTAAVGATGATGATAGPGGEGGAAPSKVTVCRRHREAAGG